jgi:cell division inhibitor SulA/protein ImuA
MNGALDALFASAAIFRARGTDLADPARHRVVPSGWPRLDAELPGGGWPLGTLIELLLPEAGVGELRLLLPALATLAADPPAAERRWLAWIAPPHAPYPPALAQSGIRPERLLFVTAPKTSDRLWAVEQALRSGSCAAVLAWLDAVDDQWLRRLKLAAEAGQALVVLLRPLRRRATASPATLRIALEPAAESVDLWVLKSRGRGPVRVHDALRP